MREVKNKRLQYKQHYQYYRSAKRYLATLAGLAMSVLSAEIVGLYYTHVGLSRWEDEKCRNPHLRINRIYNCLFPGGSLLRKDAEALLKKRLEKDSDNRLQKYCCHQYEGSTTAALFFLAMCFETIIAGLVFLGLYFLIYLSRCYGQAGTQLLERSNQIRRQLLDAQGVGEVCLVLREVSQNSPEAVQWLYRHDGGVLAVLQEEYHRVCGVTVVPPLDDAAQTSLLEKIRFFSGPLEAREITYVQGCEQPGSVLAQLPELLRQHIFAYLGGPSGRWGGGDDFAALTYPESIQRLRAFKAFDPAGCILREMTRYIERRYGKGIDLEKLFTPQFRRRLHNASQAVRSRVSCLTSGCCRRSERENHAANTSTFVAP